MIDQQYTLLRKEMEIICLRLVRLIQNSNENQEWKDKSFKQVEEDCKKIDDVIISWADEYRKQKQTNTSAS